MYLYILNNRAVADHYGILTGDVVVFAYLQGIGACSNIGKIIVHGITGYYGFISRLTKSLRDKLERNIAGSIVKADNRAADKYSRSLLAGVSLIDINR